MTAIALVLMFCLASNCAAAQGLTIGDYRRPKSEADLSFNKGYLTGIKDGLIAYNMSLENKLFCLAGDNPTLSFDQANDLMMSWARKRGSGIDAAYLNMSLLSALRERYPCSARAR